VLTDLQQPCGFEILIMKYFFVKDCSEIVCLWFGFFSSQIGGELIINKLCNLVKSVVIFCHIWAKLNFICYNLRSKN
jgi:hypothetical protein